jgi:tetratricopeptide (TPR) repeat protein
VSRPEGSLLEQARHALETGALKRAEYLLRQASNMPGEAQDAILAELMRLAELWRQSGKVVRAARLYDEIISRLETLYGMDAADLIEPLRLRAMALLDTDLPHDQACEPAEECLRRAIRLTEQYTGPESLSCGLLLMDLADLVQDHERCEEGEELAHRAWETGRTHISEDSSLFFEATDWLMWWYEAHQEWAEGRQLLQSALELAAQLLGADSPRVAELMGGLANMLLQEGRDEEEADMLCARGLEILARAYGELPVSTDFWPRTVEEVTQIRLLFSSLYSIRAHAAYVRGQPAAARFHLNRAVLMLDLPEGELAADLRTGVATAHAGVYQGLALLASDEGDQAGAEQLYRRALSYAEQGDLERHAALLDDYASWLDEHGRDLEAERARREADDLRNG